jgi:hypothetical protein
LKSYYLRSTFLSFTLFALIVMAPFVRFQLNNFFVLWPYFDWELGFGSVPFTTRWQVIYIDQIDEKVFTPPIPLNKYLLEHAPGKSQWIPTQHYKMQTMLAQAHRRKDNIELNRVKQLLAMYWFNPIAKYSVKYHLAIIVIDPVQYKKDSQYIHKKVLLSDVYTK